MAGDLADSPVTKQKAKADKVWEARAPWTQLYDECIEYVLPWRKAKGSGNSTGRVFDLTSTYGAVNFGNNLADDLFPTASEKFQYIPGPLPKGRMLGKKLISFEESVLKVSKQVDPFFQSGGFDTAAKEACYDLGMGTGAILPMHGDERTPIRFINVPFQQLAIKSDAWRRLNYASWKQTLSVEAVYEAFKDRGQFDKEFIDLAKSKPNEDCVLYQDFIKTNFGWKWVAYHDKSCTQFIIEEKTVTQPICIMRYHITPGEDYGLGVIPLALPAVKTLNKTQELTLRSAAIQMLGIWAYRAGGTFNPDTVNLGPGEFWAMQSTGGQFGADVTRLDTASGRLDVASMLIEGLRADIKMVLMDNRIGQSEGTPESAQQIIARMQERTKANMGAYGRLAEEGMPILAARATEILYQKGMVSMPMHLNELLISVRVLSPMQQALDAKKLESSIMYFDMAASIAGPQAIDEHVNPDVILKAARRVLALDEDVAPNDERRAEIRKAKAEKQSAEQAMAVALEAAKIKPDQAGQVIS